MKDFRKQTPYMINLFLSLILSYSPIGHLNQTHCCRCWLYVKRKTSQSKKKKNKILTSTFKSHRNTKRGSELHQISKIDNPVVMRSFSKIHFAGKTKIKIEGIDLWRCMLGGLVNLHNMKIWKQHKITLMFEHVSCYQLKWCFKLFPKLYSIMASIIYFFWAC